MDRHSLNEAIPRVNIKGKQYATVDARVLAFWELYPEGAIQTELLKDDGDVCVFKALVYDCGALIATGHAFEERNASYINKTSYLENCETSAVGRALGMLGIGSNGSIASADEVQGAIEQQETAKKGTAKPKSKTAHKTASGDSIERIKQLKQECLDAGVKEEGVTGWYKAKFGTTPLNKLTSVEQQEVIVHYTEVAEGAREVLKMNDTDE